VKSKLRTVFKVLAIELHFGRKRVAAEVVKSLLFFSFGRSNLISCERGAAEGVKIVILLQFLAIEPHFVEKKGCRGHFKIAKLLQFLAIERRFVRKGCVSCRLVGIAPRLQERNRKRRREQESKRARENVKM